MCVFDATSGRVVDLDWTVFHDVGEVMIGRVEVVIHHLVTLKQRKFIQ